MTAVERRYRETAAHQYSQVPIRGTNLTDYA